MSSDVAVSVYAISKSYQIYEKPRDRLLQMLFRGRKKYFREFKALSEVSFEVRKGETLGIIGRNGSGKSTLLQIICGTLNPSAGSVQVKGRIAALLELGSGFNPEFTGRENVYLNAALLGLSKDEIDQRFDDIVLFSGISDFIEQPVKTYSTGMVVRLAFSVANAVSPDILIIDEALAVGDAVFQAKCFRRFQELKISGSTVILVTHDVGLVVQLCDRALVLHNGKIVGTGSPKDMADEYRRRCAEEASNSAALDVTRELVAGVTVGCGATPGEYWLKPEEGCQQYGDMKAVVAGFCILNSKGIPQSQFSSDSEMQLRVQVHFMEACKSPIVAFGIRDSTGVDLCGTNSWFENTDIGFVDKGAVVEVHFSITPRMQSGAYLVCMACTELTDQGLVAHHRLYDVCAIEIQAIRRFTGILDVSPSVSVLRLN